jgi:hypothetical protein
VRKALWLLPVIAVLTVIAFVAVELWGGVSRSATSVLRQADRVEVFRVSPKTKASDWSRGDIGGYPILAVGKEQGPDFAARLGKVLRSWGVAKSSKKCAFEPGVAFRVWSGDRALEVLVCFKCDDLWPHVVGEPGELHDEWLEFDAVRADLVALAKEAFPDDPKIQALPAKHPGESAFYPDPAETGTPLPAAEPDGAPDRGGRK